jgi:2-polyprenyl-6-methoxyphenol hydroxylase-like FAD-dependent oxidoreductase
MWIYQSLVDMNVNIERSQFVTSNSKVFHFEGDMLGYCCEGDIEINRWDLSQIIAQAVGECEIIYGDAITQIGEKVHFEKGEPREFDLVIGADGINSRVRRLVFGPDSQFVKELGVHFCIFPIPNVFNLDRSEIAYFDKGKFVAAYAVNGHSLAAFAFKPKENLPRENLKALFEEQFKGLGWEIPRLVAAMKESDDCYFDRIAGVRMPIWSKGRVALVGDAAHAAAGIGTSLAMVGAYVLAEKIAQANGDYTTAFAEYENAIRKFVEQGQEMSDSHYQFWKGDSSWLIRFQLYLMKMLPGRFIRFLTKRGRQQMKAAANAYTLDR